MEYRIKELLKDKGITLLELSEKIGMKSPHLSVALSEKGNPTVATLEKIASALSVEVSELFTTPTTDTINCPYCGGRIKVSKEN